MFLDGNFCAGYDLKALSKVENDIRLESPAKEEIGPMVCNCSHFVTESTCTSI